LLNGGNKPETVTKKTKTQEQLYKKLIEFLSTIQKVKTIKWFKRTKESKNSLKVFFFFSKLDFVRIYPERETANVSWNEISE
jgi:hypothetical protein